MRSLQNINNILQTSRYGMTSVAGSNLKLHSIKLPVGHRSPCSKCMSSGHFMYSALLACLCLRKHSRSEENMSLSVNPFKTDNTLVCDCCACSIE